MAIGRGRRAEASGLRGLVAAVLLCAAIASSARAADTNLPELTQPVNDFAHVIDPASTEAIDRVSRALQAASGDVIVVATVKTVAPYADIREYANRLFENHGRGIGQKGKDNGLLIVLAVDERQVWIEVGYALEPYITDGFAGETSRQVMVPLFRTGQYGRGLRAGVERVAGRIADARGVSLQGVPPVRAPSPAVPDVPFWVIVAIFIAIVVFSRFGGGPGAPVRRWGRRGWSGWSSGVGPFGGGWSGGGWSGGGGGGFGGGFGGFGGGRSGGGGGGAGW
jgi:uncharacterized protein